ncbi:MAG: ribosomal-processing cysteine protease Prp [Anaeroplasmataceae bacterium]|nr:ribosomal-processing cysteine protease Prp [Anaeroplasmataceae bacterium]
MATYKIIRKDKEATVEVQGHANYSGYGTDIVCASISTACIFTANLIEKLNLSYNIIDLVCEEGYFRLQVKTTDTTANAIFENLEYTLEEISKQYPKNLKYIN